jgi:hypothetical protein
MVEKDIGFVGEVTKVDARLIQTLVNDGTIPVLATVASSPSGESLNVNADIAAGEVRHLSQVEESKMSLYVLVILAGCHANIVVHADLQLFGCVESTRHWSFRTCLVRLSCTAIHVYGPNPPKHSLRCQSAIPETGCLVWNCSWRQH